MGGFPSSYRASTTAMVPQNLGANRKRRNVVRIPQTRAHVVATQGFLWVELSVPYHMAAQHPLRRVQGGHPTRTQTNFPESWSIPKFFEMNKCLQQPGLLGYGEERNKSPEAPTCLQVLSGGGGMLAKSFAFCSGGYKQVRTLHPFSGVFIIATFLSGESQHNAHWIDKAFARFCSAASRLRICFCNMPSSRSVEATSLSAAPWRCEFHMLQYASVR